MSDLAHGREDEAAIVALPPLGTPLYVLAIYLVLVLGLLGGAVAVALMAPWGQGATSPLWFIVPLVVTGGVLAAVVFPHLRRTVASRRMLREARALLERHEAGRERATGAQLAAAVLAVEGCRQKQPVRLRRWRIDHWENRLRTHLPRVIIEDGRAVVALREMLRIPPETAAVEDDGERAHLWAHLDGVPWRYLFSFLLAVAIIGGLALLIGHFSGWSINGVGGMLVMKLVGAVLLAAVAWTARALMGRGGWVFSTDRGQLWLRRTSRGGRALAASQLDRREIIVVIADAAGRKDFRGEDVGRTAWRIIPSEGVRPFQLRDPDPRLLPWGPAVAAAVGLE